MLKRLLKLLLVLTNVNACGTEPIITAIVFKPAKLDVAPELQPILDHYLTVAPDYGAYDELVVLQFGDPDGNKTACDVRYKKLAGKKMRVERGVIVSDMLDISRPSQAALVYRELAVCLHGAETSKDDLSIMAAAVLEDDQFWDENLDAKLAEVFK